MGKYYVAPQGGGFGAGLAQGINSTAAVYGLYQSAEDREAKRRQQEAIQSAATQTPTEVVGRDAALEGLDQAYLKAGENGELTPEQEAAFREARQALQSRPAGTTHEFAGQTQDTPFTPEQQQAGRTELMARAYESNGDPEKAVTLRNSALQTRAAQQGIDKAATETRVNQQVADMRQNATTYNTNMQAAGGMDAVRRTVQEGLTHPDPAQRITPEQAQAATAAYEQANRQQSPEAVAMRGADAYSRLDPAKAAGLEKTAVDLARERMQADVFNAYATGGLPAVVEAYNGRYTDGFTSKVSQDAKTREWIITTASDKDPTKTTELRVPATPEGEQLFIARQLAGADPKHYLQSLQMDQTRKQHEGDRAQRGQQHKDTLDETKRHNKASEGIAAKNADTRVAVAEAKAKAAEDKANKPGTGDLKPKDGLSVIQSHYGGKFEGGMYFPDEKNKDTALRAVELLEQNVQAGMSPMAAAKKAAEEADREKATGTLQVGKAPKAGAPAPGSSSYRGLWSR